MAHLLELSRWIPGLEMLDVRLFSTSPTPFDDFISEALDEDVSQRISSMATGAAGLRSQRSLAAPAALPCQSKLTLVIGQEFAAAALAELAKSGQGFCWAGLQVVKLELIAGLENTLTGLIVARQAAARGVTEEQYFAILNDADKLLSSKKKAPKREAFHALTTKAAATIPSSSSTATPLCPEVVWNILAPRSISPVVREWLEEQRNVLLMIGA